MGRSQAATEQIAVIAMISLIIIPTAFIFMSYSQKSQEDLKNGMINRLGRNVVDTAETVYYYGPPSRSTLLESMPDNVRNISILNDTNKGAFELLITLKAGGDRSFISPVEIRGEFDAKSASPGSKRVIIQAMKDSRNYVQINIT